MAVSTHLKLVPLLVWGKIDLFFFALTLTMLNDDDDCTLRLHSVSTEHSTRGGGERKTFLLFIRENKVKKDKLTTTRRLQFDLIQLKNVELSWVDSVKLSTVQTHKYYKVHTSTYFFDDGVYSTFLFIRCTFNHHDHRCHVTGNECKEEWFLKNVQSLYRWSGSLKENDGEWRHNERRCWRNDITERGVQVDFLKWISISIGSSLLLSAHF